MMQWHGQKPFGRWCRLASGMLPCIVAALLLAAVPVRGAAPRGDDDPVARFRAANERYEQGAYEEAAREYEQLVDAEVREPDLYYNLGNTYFKLGDMGRAVLNYERALRLSPRDDDVRSNLALVRSLLKDKQFVADQNWIARAVTWLQRNLSLDESLVLSSILYVLFALLAIGLIFYDTASVGSFHRRLYAVSPGRLLGLGARHDFILALVVTGLLFCAAAGISAYKVAEYTQRSRAVIVSGEVPVYSAPSDESVLQFRIHSGTRIRIRENRDPWIHISLPGGLSGWIPAGTVEII